jgi:O-antigen/teichoic acid export membrane protein
LGFVMGRALGPTAFGQFAAATAFVGFFRILPDFGMSYASTLEVARDRARAAPFFGALLAFQAALSALTLALAIGLGAWLYEGTLFTAVVVLSVDLVLKAIKASLRWLLKSHERFGSEALSLSIERGLLLALGMASLMHGGGLTGLVAVFAGVRLLDTLGLGVWVHRRVLALVPRWDPTLWRELFVKGLPFAYAGVMVTLFFQVDQVMLERLRGASETGFYKAPVLVLEGLTLVPRVFGFAFIPTMAAQWATRPDLVAALYRRGLKYLVLVGLPIAAFGALAAEPFLGLLFGAAYAPSAAPARLLLPACVAMFVSNFAETTLACIGRVRVIVWTSTLALLINIALNALWIPRFGASGAAAATLLTEALYALLGTLALRRAGLSAPWPTLAWRPLLAAAVFALGLACTLPYGLLPAAGVASALWVAATFALGVWDASERAALRGLLPSSMRAGRAS